VLDLGRQSRDNADEFRPRGGDLLAKPWTQEARAAVAPIWDCIFQHPFLQELRAGTLPDARLRFYFEQNVSYIAAVRVFRAVAAAKAPTQRAYNFCITPAGPPGHDELEHQRQMLASLGGDAHAPMAPACYGYTRHLLAIAWSRPTVDLLAAFLACPWTYDEIGKQVKGVLTKESHREWMAFYSSPSHNEFCDDYRNLVDELADDLTAEQRADLVRQFVTSSKYEYWFWDMAYRRETWEAD
jgi:thiaminase/transcriptional activator TenA